MRGTARINVFGLALLLGLLCFAWAPAPGQAEEVIKLKAATIYPLKHRMVTDCFDIYTKEIEKRTNGKVTITWFHASSLVGQDRMHDAVSSGMVDMAWLSIFQDPHLFPVSLGVGLPFMADSALHAAMIGHAMWEQIPELKDEWSKFKLLGLGSSDVTNMVYAKKIAPKTPEEMKGLRMGGGLSQLMDILKLLPCAPQYVKTEDIYLGLQRRMIDGVFFPDAPLRSFRFTDVTQGHTMGNFVVTPYALAMRKESWDKLPPEVQKVFNELDPSLILLAGHTLSNEGQWVIQALKERGDAFYYLTPEDKAQWSKLLNPLFEQYVTKLNEKGYDGAAILAKLKQISEDKRKNPDSESYDWWKASNMGKARQK